MRELKDAKEKTRETGKRVEIPDVWRNSVGNLENIQEKYHRKLLLSRIDRAIKNILEEYRDEIDEKSFRGAADNVKEKVENRFTARGKDQTGENDEDLLASAFEDSLAYYRGKGFITGPKRKLKEGYLTTLSEAVQSLQPMYEDALRLVSMPEGAVKCSTERKVVKGDFGMNTCIPDTVGMLLDYHGISDTVDNIRKGVKHDRKEGSTLENAVFFLREKELTVYKAALFPDTKDTLRELISIQGGEPCILQYGSVRSEMSHAVIVDSIDSNDMVVLRDPLPHIGAIKCPLDEVAKRWMGGVVTQEKVVDLTWEWVYGNVPGFSGK